MALIKQKFICRTSLAVALCLSALLSTVAIPAWAVSEPAPVVAAELKQFLVQVEGGKEVLRPVQSVKPGDLLEYRVVYSNQSSRPVREMVAELPIPEGMEYQPNSMRPRLNSEAAVNGGAFGREPLMRETVGGRLEAVPYAEYRKLRWVLGSLTGGGRVEVTARARVAPTRSASGNVSPAGQKSER